MKKVNYKKVSSKRCIDCNKPLKKNLVMRNPHATRCYCCWNISKRKYSVTRTKKKIIYKGFKESVKEIDYKKIQKQNRRYYGYYK